MDPIDKSNSPPIINIAAAIAMIPRLAETSKKFSIPYALNIPVSPATIPKKINTKIKTVHYVAPQVWVWREGRVKKIKNFIDHILLLFNFEKNYFDNENMSNEFVGHPLLEQKTESAIDINQILGKNKALISIFSGSRRSEITVLTPIIIDFIITGSKRDQTVKKTKAGIEHHNTK